MGCKDTRFTVPPRAQIRQNDRKACARPTPVCLAVVHTHSCDVFVKHISSYVQKGAPCTGRSSKLLQLVTSCPL